MNAKYIFYFLALFYAVPVEGNIFRVGSNQHYKSVQRAIHAADSGDTILIHAGRYEEGSIVIDKRLTIIGLNMPVISGSKKYEVILINADGVHVEGLRIVDVGVSYLKDLAAIRIKDSDSVTIYGNDIYNAFFGIYVAKSHYATISNNQVIGQAIQEHNSGNAIHLWACTHATIQNNTVKHHRDGIYLEFVDHSTIISNYSSNNLRYGLHFMFSNYDEYNHNVFTNNGAGVAVMFSRYIEMCYNTFSHNWGPAAYGLLLKEIYDAVVEYNLFHTNSTAIHAEGVTRTLIQLNNFERNGWALNVGGSCMDNLITFNNFVNNTFDIIGSSNGLNTVYENNYWSNYSGYDLDKDKVGDVPHRPVKLFNYILNRVPESIVLLRSPFVDLMSVAEKISPVFTPENIIDLKPATRKFHVENP